MKLNLRLRTLLFLLLALVLGVPLAGATASHPAATTLITRVMLGNQPKADPGDMIYLVGMSPTDDAAPTALSLAMRNVSMGWFGASWRVELVSESGIIPAALATREIGGASRALDVITISSQPLAWGQEYDAILGYDPATGQTAVAIYHVDGGRLFAARALQLLPSAQPVHPWPASAETATAWGGSAQVRRVDQFDSVVPFGLALQMTQQSATETSRVITGRVDRRLNTSAKVTLPWDVAPGNLQLVARQPGQERAAGTWPIHTTQPTPIPLVDLPVGDYQVTLQYVTDRGSWDLSAQQFTIGVVSAQIANLHVTRLEDGMQVTGSLVVDSDGIVPAVELGVQADLLGHQFRTDPRTNSWTTQTHRLDSPITVPPTTVTLRGDELTLPFSVVVPLPLDSIPQATWGVQLQPTVSPAGHLSPTSTAEAWLGREPDTLAWQHFLSDPASHKTEVAPGVSLYSVRGNIAAGPLQMYLLEIDLTQPGLYLDALLGGRPAAGVTRWPRSPVSQMTREANAIAGINAGFFEISSTMNPRGLIMQSGELIKSAIPNWETAVGFSPEGKAFVGSWRWQGGIRSADGLAYRSAVGLNVTHAGNNQLTLFAWPWSQSPGTERGLFDVVEVVVDRFGSFPDANDPNVQVIQGTVRELREQRPGIRLEPEMMVVTAYGNAADWLLSTYGPGDTIEVGYSLVGETSWPYLESWRDLRAIVPGGVVLVRNGTYGDVGVQSNPERHPRTALAVSWDQNTLYWLVVEGRSGRSVGMTYKEMADFFLNLGAFHAVNFDGGGSSALAILDPVTGRTYTVNLPSDGTERLVPDGLGLFLAR